MPRHHPPTPGCKSVLVSDYYSQNFRSDFVIILRRIPRMPVSKLALTSMRTKNTQANPIEPSGTRERILIESAKLFSRQGYVGTSTREITEAVGISQPGLYRHFRSKEEIILALGDAILDPLVHIISEERKQSSTRAVTLASFIFRVCYQLVQSPYSAQFWISWPYEASQFTAAKTKYTKIGKYLDEIIKEGINNEEFRDIPVGLARETILNLIISGVFQGVGDIKNRIEYVVEVSLRSVIKNSSSIKLALSSSRKRLG